MARRASAAMCLVTAFGLARAWRFVFWLGVAAICAVSLLPQEHVPQTGLIDKWQHVAAYFAVMAVSYPAYPPLFRLEVRAASGLIILGAVLELIQSFLPDRFMSLADTFANVAGVALAVVLARLLARVSCRYRRGGE